MNAEFCFDFFLYLFFLSHQGPNQGDCSHDDDDVKCASEMTVMTKRERGVDDDDCPELLQEKMSMKQRSQEKSGSESREGSEGRYSHNPRNHVDHPSSLSSERD